MEETKPMRKYYYAANIPQALEILAEDIRNGDCCIANAQEGIVAALSDVANALNAIAEAIREHK